MIKRLMAILLAITIFVCCTGICEAAGTIRLKKGSRGEDVIELQTGLKEQGYYNEKIDGIYGTIRPRERDARPNPPACRGSQSALSAYGSNLTVMHALVATSGQSAQATFSKNLTVMHAL